MLLNNKFVFSIIVGDIKALPGGLLVIAISESKKLLTYSISDGQHNEIFVGGKPRMITILDRNTVVVQLSRKMHRQVNSIELVDIRQKQVIQHVDLRLDSTSHLFVPMFYTDDQLYIGNHSGITVMDMSGTIDRTIDLEFEPTDMCYDTNSTRIYCIGGYKINMICIDRDGNTIFTFTNTCLIALKSIILDHEGYVLMCHHNKHDFKVNRLSPDGKSSETIITGKKNESSHLFGMCLQEESDEVAIAINERVYTYKKK